MTRRRLEVKLTSTLCWIKFSTRSTKKILREWYKKKKFPPWSSDSMKILPQDTLVFNIHTKERPRVTIGHRCLKISGPMFAAVTSVRSRRTPTLLKNCILSLFNNSLTELELIFYNFFHFPWQPVCDSSYRLSYQMG